VTVFSVARTTPEQAGFRPEVVRALDEHLQGLVGRQRLQAASYLLARNGQVFAMNAFGKRTFREEDDTPMRTDTIRRIASVTKLFTAVAVFQLVEQGRLRLRQPAAEWLEEMDHPMYRNIRLWHLLTHTSGVRADPGYFSEPYPYSFREIRFAFEPRPEASAEGTGTEPGDGTSETADGKDSVDGSGTADGAEPAGRDAGATGGASGTGDGNRAAELEKRRKSAWIRALLAGKPQCEPGRTWNYSTGGYMLLGEIIARASGMPYEAYVMRHIVEPLGMTRTFFRVPEQLHGEVCVTSDWEEQWLAWHDRTYDPPLAGGGMYSTLEDLFRFGQMLLQNGRWGSERILSRKSVERMTRDHFAGRNLFGYAWGGRRSNMSYGMGAEVTGENQWLSPGSFGHEGAGRCKLLIDPRHQAVVVFFVPTAIDWVPESIINTSHLIAAGWV